MSLRSSLRYTKPAALAVVVGFVVLAHRLGWLEAFRDPSHAKATLVGLGSWGHVAFIVAYTLLQPFGVPGTVFVMAAPLVWPWTVAFALSMIGTMTASIVGFSFARFVARDWVSEKVPERVRRYEKMLERRAFTTVALLRFIFWMPQWLHVFFGVSRVSFSTHFWGSLVGYAVPLLLMSLYGRQIFDLVRGVSPRGWVLIAVAAAVLVCGVWVYQKRRLHRHRERLRPEPGRR